MKNIFIAVFLFISLSCLAQENKNYLGKRENCIIIELLVDDNMDFVRFKVDTLNSDTLKYILNKSVPQMKDFPILYFVDKICVKQEVLFVDAILSEQE